MLLEEDEAERKCKIKERCKISGATFMESHRALIGVLIVDTLADDDSTP